jgi:hypothetical protein
MTTPTAVPPQQTPKEVSDRLQRIDAVLAESEQKRAKHGELWQDVAGLATFIEQTLLELKAAREELANHQPK